MRLLSYRVIAVATRVCNEREPALLLVLVRRSVDKLAGKSQQFINPRLRANKAGVPPAEEACLSLTSGRRGSVPEAYVRTDAAAP